LPDLIKDIEATIKAELLFKKEILSINQVRNCLVHDGGIVTERRINNLELQTLQLNYVDLITIIDIEGKIVETTWDIKMKTPTVAGIAFDRKEREINFCKGEKVKVNQNIFNGVSYTCLEFIQNLVIAVTKPLRLQIPEESLRVTPNAHLVFK
jgi:hypothetical protein